MFAEEYKKIHQQDIDEINKVFNQEELLKSFYNDDFSEEKKEEYEKLFINLSPYFRKH